MVLNISPSELLKETIEGFDIQTDLNTIDRISGNLRALHNERELRLLTEQKELSELSHRLANQKQILDDLETSNQRAEIKNKIKENQSLELDLNKKLKEFTSAKQDLSTQLSNLVDEFNDLDKQIESLDSIDDEEDKDAIVYVYLLVMFQLIRQYLILLTIKHSLKLIVYRKLGLRVDLKSSVLIIYNKEKRLTDYLNYDDEKYSDYFISNYIWDRF